MSTILCICVFCVFFVFSGFSFVAFFLQYFDCWLGLLTCKNRLPCNLYCVGGDVKSCTIQSNPGTIAITHCIHEWMWTSWIQTVDNYSTSEVFLSGSVHVSYNSFKFSQFFVLVTVQQYGFVLYVVSCNLYVTTEIAYSAWEVSNCWLLLLSVATILILERHASAQPMLSVARHRVVRPRAWVGSTSWQISSLCLCPVHCEFKCALHVNRCNDFLVCRHPIWCLTYWQGDWIPLALKTFWMVCFLIYQSKCIVMSSLIFYHVSMHKLWGFGDSFQGATYRFITLKQKQPMCEKDGPQCHRTSVFSQLF